MRTVIQLLLWFGFCACLFFAKVGAAWNLREYMNSVRHEQDFTWPSTGVNLVIFGSLAAVVCWRILKYCRNFRADRALVTAGVSWLALAVSAALVLLDEWNFYNEWLERSKGEAAFFHELNEQAKRLNRPQGEYFPDRPREHYLYNAQPCRASIVGGLILGVACIVLGYRSARWRFKNLFAQSSRWRS